VGASTSSPVGASTGRLIGGGLANSTWPRTDSGALLQGESRPGLWSTGAILSAKAVPARACMWLLAGAEQGQTALSWPASQEVQADLPLTRSKDQATAGYFCSAHGLNTNTGRWFGRELDDGDAVAAFGAAAIQNGLAVLGGHASAKTVGALAAGVARIAKALLHLVPRYSELAHGRGKAGPLTRVASGDVRSPDRGDALGERCHAGWTAKRTQMPTCIADNYKLAVGTGTCRLQIAQFAPTAGRSRALGPHSIHEILRSGSPRSEMPECPEAQASACPAIPRLLQVLAAKHTTLW
jgi:hypothetical protein